MVSLNRISASALQSAEHVGESTLRVLLKLENRPAVIVTNSSNDSSVSA